MAADLYIHVLTDEVTEEVLARFFNSTMGSKWFQNQPYKEAELNWREDYKLVGGSPKIWVGEVSWLKAALFEDGDSYIPSAVATVSDLIGEELPIVDDDLIAGVRQAFDLPNNTAKEGGVMSGQGYHLAKADEVVAFLEQHKGKRVFTVSW